MGDSPVEVALGAGEREQRFENFARRGEAMVGRPGPVVRERNWARAAGATARRRVSGKNRRRREIMENRTRLAAADDREPVGAGGGTEERGQFQVGKSER